MGYRGPMGFFIKVPAHRVGGPEKLWGIGVYGLSGVWVMGVSTVFIIGLTYPTQPLIILEIIQGVCLITHPNLTHI